MHQKYSIASARDQLAKLVHDAEAGKAVELTRRGKSVAVILAIEDYQRLQKKPTSFIAALRKLRSEIDFEELGVEREDWLEPRDPSPGRPVTPGHQRPIRTSSRPPSGASHRLVRQELLGVLHRLGRLA